LCTTTRLEGANLLLQFLDVQDGLLEDLQFELFFLFLLALTGLLRVPGPNFVVLVVLVETLITTGR
jgi:hypothetical protein